MNSCNCFLLMSVSDQCGLSCSYVEGCGVSSTESVCSACMLVCMRYELRCGSMLSGSQCCNHLLSMKGGRSKLKHVTVNVHGLSCSYVEGCGVNSN